MSCAVRQVDGKTVFAIGPRVPVWFCPACGKIAKLVCDGCDAPVCEACSVSPRTGLDFCPACCRPYFKEWCGTEEGKRYATGHRELRRDAFRAWVKTYACLRLESIRTKASHEVEAANHGTLNPKPRKKKR